MDIQSTFEIQTVQFYRIQFLSDCRMVTSLDRFIKKRVVKKYVFITKRSRLEVKKIWAGFRMQNGRQTIQKPDTNCVRKMTIRKPDSLDIGC